MMLIKKLQWRLLLLIRFPSKTLRNSPSYWRERLKSWERFQSVRELSPCMIVLWQPTTYICSWNIVMEVISNNSLRIITTFQKNRLFLTLSISARPSKFVIKIILSIETLSQPISYLPLMEELSYLILDLLEVLMKLQWKKKSNIPFWVPHCIWVLKFC